MGWLCGNCGTTNPKGSIECDGCGGLRSIVKDMKNFTEGDG